MILRYALCATAMLAVLGVAPTSRAQSQLWCAEYDDGTRNCGISSEQSCRQSVTGVGGVCVPETDNRPREAFPILRELVNPREPDANLPGSNPSDMPPPPVR
jgi:hypothetical protein